MPIQLAKKFEELWALGNGPPDVFAFLQQHDDFDVSQQVAVLLIDQQHRWKSDSPLKVEDYLDRIPGLANDSEVKLRLAVGEFNCRTDSNAAPGIDDFVARFSDISEELRSKLSALLPDFDEQKADTFATLSQTTESSFGARIGRYRLVRVLGEGAFGRVFLGFDEELQRQVAIKVPTKDRFQKPEDADQYLAEARMVASLNHPNIVPVYDTGRADDGSIHVVSKFIEGCTLDERIKRDRPSYDEAARVLIIVAQALHHAHQRRLIHRDVRPANILLESDAVMPYVADFGLAIREEDYVKDSKIAGTPAYMSPEQARGEGTDLMGVAISFHSGQFSSNC